MLTLYKKGNVEDPANYRPMSLLQSLYNIFASLVQTRLRIGIDDRIWGMQHGFRKARSTSQPLFLTRRLQDFAEGSGDKLVLLFLDWEQALDKVDHEGLIDSIERLNIPR